MRYPSIDFRFLEVSSSSWIAALAALNWLWLVSYRFTFDFSKVFLMGNFEYYGFIDVLGRVKL